MTRAALWLIRAYRRRVSPFLPAVCRFTPTCSQYAAQALEIHGLWKGAWLSVKRLARCHPLCEGGEDPVPPPALHPVSPPSEGNA